MAKLPIPQSPNQIRIEIQPAISGPLAGLGKTPVLIVNKLALRTGARIELEIDPDDIHVLPGDLDESDRAKIEKTMQEKVLESGIFNEILFAVSDYSVSDRNGSIMVSGSLTLHGETVPIYLPFKPISGGRLEARIALRQSDFGIKPVTAMLGALRCEDELAIRCVVDLTAE